MSYLYRPIQTDDLDLVCQHRIEMFKASGRTEEMLAPMAEPFRSWLAPRIASGAYFGWIAEAEGRPVGGLGMMIIDWPPHPSHLTDDRRGYVLNVYVEPEHRGRGIALELMRLATDAGREAGLSLMVLHATAMGRPIYEKLGWKQTSEMSLKLA
jgi:GNAT superfamily N-acetyltransferase